MSGKNLFDINSLKKYEVDNNDLKASVDNEKIVLEGKGVKTSEAMFFCFNKTADLLKLNPGKYALSFKSNMPMGTVHESKTVEAFAIIKKTDGSSTFSSTGLKGYTVFEILDGDTVYFRFDINNGTMTAEFYDIQLEYGSSATAYEPYTGGQPSPSPDYPQPIEITDQPVTVTVKGSTEQQSITLIPPRPFTKWDKLEKVNGVWCWVYQSENIIFDGSEDEKWIKNQVIGDNAFSLNYTNAQYNTILCDRLMGYTGALTNMLYNAIAEISNLISVKVPNIETVEAFRAWLAENNLNVWHKVDKTDSVPLTPSEQAQLNTLTMYAGTTEITNNGGCTMDLTYTADTKTYIDNKLAAISAAVLEV